MSKKRKSDNPIIIIAIVILSAVVMNLNQDGNEKTQEKYGTTLSAEETAQAEKLRVELMQKRQKADSSIAFLNSAKQLIANNKLTKSLVLLDSALVVWPDNNEAVFEKARVLQKKRKISNAIELYSGLVEKDFFKDGLVHLEYAKCLKRKKREEDAVLQAYLAMELGLPEGKDYYNKINPEKKVVIGYNTRCCDGTISYSTGRGTCSHHGGVCNWNEPIYRVQRKYKIEG